VTVNAVLPWGPVLAYSAVGSVSPLGHEVREVCALDNPGGAEHEMECLELDVPLCDSSDSVGAPEYPFQRVSRDDLDWVTLKVVSQHTRGHQERE